MRAVLTGIGAVSDGDSENKRRGKVPVRPALEDGSARVRRGTENSRVHGLCGPRRKGSPVLDHGDGLAAIASERTGQADGCDARGTTLGVTTGPSPRRCSARRETKVLRAQEKNSTRDSGDATEA